MDGPATFAAGASPAQAAASSSASRSGEPSGSACYIGADTSSFTPLSCGNTVPSGVSADDRLRNASRVTYSRDIGPQSVPLPSGEHLSCVRPSLAAGIAGLTASASSVPARVPQRGCFAAAPLPAANRPTVLPATQRERHGKAQRPIQ